MAFGVIDQTLVRELLDYDPATGILTWRPRDSSHFRDGARFSSNAQCKRWNTRYASKPAGATCNGYLIITIQQKQLWAHRVIWLWMTGEWPREHIDHIDLDRGNNRWSNLREASREENIANRRALSNSRTGVKGVKVTEDGTWCAHIRTPSGRKYLGTFKTIEEASKAYVTAAKKYHGSFART